MTSNWNPESVGYCANVHPTLGTADLIHNIAHYASDVREKLALTSMAYGLWIPNKIASSLHDSQHSISELKDTLLENSVSIRTINAFPYGNFHQKIVKASVYTPTWAETSRVLYTMQIAKLFVKLMGSSQQKGSISTLPLGYKTEWHEELENLAIKNLCSIANQLSDLEANTGKRIIVCIEMEPDCALESTSELVVFFEKLRSKSSIYQANPDTINRYLGICFDVCHQAVMHEAIAHSLKAIHSNDITIGKVQISNALRIKQQTDISAEEFSLLIDEKYLHQMKAGSESKIVDSVQDLNKHSIHKLANSPYEWRIHFHVPVYLEEFSIGNTTINTTRHCIDETLLYLHQNPELEPDIEIETYTLPVLLSHQEKNYNDSDLIATLVTEMNWLHTRMQHVIQ